MKGETPTKGTPEQTEQVDRMMEALELVHVALEPLSPDARARVVRTVCILMDIDA